MHIDEFCKYCMHKRMDWRKITFDWNRARAFLVTAEEGSLSAAARALGMTQPTLGRQVAALEDELGVTLFERVGRGLTLTPSGLALVDHVRAMGEAANAVSRAALGQEQSIDGHVAITASEIYAAHLLPPVLARLRDLAPGITVEVVASNTLRDLGRREADIALRNAQPAQDALIARKLCDDHGALFATRDCLARHAPINDAQDLARLPFLGIENVEALITGLQGFGVPVTADSFAVLTGSHLVHWEMAKAGLGVGVVPVWLGDAEPAVTRACPATAPIPYPVWLVAHREVRTSRRVRLVYDLLAETIPGLIRGDAQGSH